MHRLIAKLLCQINLYNGRCMANVMIISIHKYKHKYINSDIGRRLSLGSHRSSDWLRDKHSPFIDYHIHRFYIHTYIYILYNKRCIRIPINTTSCRSIMQLHLKKSVQHSVASITGNVKNIDCHSGGGRSLVLFVPKMQKLHHHQHGHGPAKIDTQRRVSATPKNGQGKKHAVRAVSHHGELPHCLHPNGVRRIKVMSPKIVLGV